MKRIVILTLVALIMLLPVAAFAQGPKVSFKDDNLQAAIKYWLENEVLLKEVKDIDQADMKLLKELYAEGLFVAGDVFDIDNNVYRAVDTDPIRDITGLEYGINLKWLDLSWNNIKDISPIRNLPLTYLNLLGNDTRYDGNIFVPGTPAFSYNPSSPQMQIIQDIQHRGAVVRHDGLVKRISGPDRYQTAVRIFQNMVYGAPFGADAYWLQEWKADDYEDGYDDSAVEPAFFPTNRIIMASGENWPDALVAAPLACAMADPDRELMAADMPVPILLTTQDKLHPATRAALVNYIEEFEDWLLEMGGSFDVTIVGGEAAVSDAVANALIYAIESEFSAIDVRLRRVAGADRYETAKEVAKRMVTILGDGICNDFPIIASGENYPDALCASVYAAQNWAPVLLTRQDSLSAATADFIKKYGADTNDDYFDETYVAGGAVAVSEKVIDELLALTHRSGGQNVPALTRVNRVWGNDRYATALRLAEEFGYVGTGPGPTKGLILDGGWYNWNEVDGFWGTGETDNVFRTYVATGENWPDALAGGALAAWDVAPILLTRQNSTPSSTSDALDYHDLEGDFTSEVYILGGEAAVSRHVAVLLYNLVRFPAWAPR